MDIVWFYFSFQSYEYTKSADLPIREHDITGVFDELTFSIDDDQFGERKTVDLIPNGSNIPVTNENKKQYVEYVHTHLHVNSVHRNKHQNYN